MKKQSMILFIAAAILAAAAVVGGFFFLQSQIGEVRLTEETLLGSAEEADGLAAGFRADGAEELHWNADYNFSHRETESSFKRGEMITKTEPFIYDDFRFTAWSQIPYTTLLKTEELDGLQEKEIHKYYEALQEKTSAEEEVLTGEIKLQDYLDYYPISYRFQFGTKIFNSNDALSGLKLLASGSKKNGGRAYAYDEDLKLFTDINRFFRIPVIENEYQIYEASKGDVQIETPLRSGADFYRFDPVIVLQEENLADGKNWVHPNLGTGDSPEEDDNYTGKTAEEYNLKNRMLFFASNRTVRGKKVDFSQVKGGYGIYELPVEVEATATVRYGKRSRIVPNPKPLSDELSMVYPLDEDAEYVEMSLSDDHRILAVFFVKGPWYYMDLIDADTWTKKGSFKMFAASERMTYAWGENGSLAVTNHQDEIAVFCKTKEGEPSYKLVYGGEVPENFDEVFFDRTADSKENSFVKYQCGYAHGLAIAEKNGKIAFAQNPFMRGENYSLRGPSLECAVISGDGILYWGRLHSNVTDLDVNQDIPVKLDAEDEGLLKQMIVPIRNENWVEWK